MIPVKGFLTKDNKFFLQEEDAVHHETRAVIIQDLQNSLQSSSIDPNDLIAFLTTFTSDVIVFCSAYIAMKELQARIENARPNSETDDRLEAETESDLDGSISEWNNAEGVDGQSEDAEHQDTGH